MPLPGLFYLYISAFCDNLLAVFGEQFLVEFICGEFLSTSSRTTAYTSVVKGYSLGM